MDESLDENYETCHEDLEDTLDSSFVSVDELGNTPNSSNDIDVKEVIVKEITVASLVISLHIQSNRVSAVVDTAAQVSVINLSLARQLGLHIDDTQFIYLRGVVPNERIPGYMIKDVPVCLGKTFFADLYAADIAYSILLGLDFLLKHKCIVDLTLQLDSCTITRIVKRTEHGNNIDIRKIFVQKRTVIPPNTVICANAALDWPSINEGMHVVLEPLKTNKKIVMAATVIDPGNVAAVNIMNPTYGTIVIKPGKHIDNAVDLGEELETVGHFDLRSTAPVYNATTSYLENPDLPTHLCELYARACENLNAEESAKVKTLLMRNKDVFAKHDLDLGVFLR